MRCTSPPVAVLAARYVSVRYSLMADKSGGGVEEFCGPIVAIGASGPQGLGDIGRVLGQLPVELQAVVMVVLHRPSDQVSNLRAVLARTTKLPVLIAGQDVRLQQGQCYIGLPDAHLELAARSLGNLIPADGHLHRNRTIDLLFKSVAMHAGPRFIGVILSGALDDGSRGLAAIHHAGGVTMVLTPGGSAYAGMPESAIAYDGPIDVVGSPERIAAEIISRVGVGKTGPTPIATPVGVE